MSLHLPSQNELTSGIAPAHAGFGHVTVRAPAPSFFLEVRTPCKRAITPLADRREKCQCPPLA
jgi:hypothetical protein